MKAWLSKRRFNYIDAVAIVFSALAPHDGNKFVFVSCVVLCAVASVSVERSVKPETKDE